MSNGPTNTIYFDIVTLFPEIVDQISHGVIGKATALRKISFQCWNPRIYSPSPFGHIDDRPYGGGPGQVLSPKPLMKTLEHIPHRSTRKRTVLLSPEGAPLNHRKAKELSHYEQMILVCGRYEGLDQRFIEKNIDETISIGDYVLTGGELPAMVLCDTVARLVPGVLGNNESSQCDSFANDLIDHPHYTRPSSICGLTVPEVLTSGDHQRIAQWRHQQSLGRTWLMRPDLLMGKTLNDREVQQLHAYLKKHEQKGDNDE